MPKLGYDPMEDGNTASANLWNVRLSAIHDLLNGNLDAANLANGAVTTPKIADGAVTSSKLDINRYTDDNGWNVTDHGSYKEWSTVITGTPNQLIQSGGCGDFITKIFPIGIVNRNDINVTFTLTANDRVFVLSDETPQTGGTSLVMRISNWYGSAVTLSKYMIEIQIKPRNV